MGKYPALMHELERNGMLGRANLHKPDFPLTVDLKRAHDAAYVEAVQNAAVEPVIEKLIGFPVTRKVADRALLATAGTMRAAELAHREGIACNTAGGSHHAKRSHGAGFCTLNDVAVAALALIDEGKANQVLVVDCDVHQGDGTAEILAGLDAVFTLSIHAEKNFPTRKVASTLDIGLPDGVKDEAYLEVLDDALQQALKRFVPDFVFYNAGVDVHADDSLGRLSLSNAGIFARDRLVFERFARRNIPVCGVIGGGYSKDLGALAKKHALLFEAAEQFC
jgi:acetoin utilization deacetylase AcuC-like enzyme